MATQRAATTTGARMAGTGCTPYGWSERQESAAGTMPRCLEEPLVKQGSGHVEQGDADGFRGELELSVDRGQRQIAADG
jgi:hypothetical protein